METTVAQKLEALVKLQKIDSRIDSIIKVRGALPDEVSDLEDEIAGYDTRVEKFNSEIKECEEGISNKKNAIKESQKLIKKYTEQQGNVRNNREYDAITKEMELQDLEIQISEKKIKETHAKIEGKNLEIDETKGILSERKKDLSTKKDELKVLTTESEEEEKKLGKERTRAVNKADERLYKSYERVRGNARNGLAVVTVKRSACGGCFNLVPPQRQADIREKKKITVCEHCGRILADVDKIEIEEVKLKRTVRKKKTS